MSNFKEYSHTERVNAYQCTENESVVTAEGIASANTGDYVVQSKHGVFVMERDVFEEHYEVTSTNPSKKNGGNTSK